MGIADKDAITKQAPCEFKTFNDFVFDLKEKQASTQKVFKQLKANLKRVETGVDTFPLMEKRLANGFKKELDIKEKAAEANLKEAG